MNQFHINKTTGRIARCRAKKNCPFQETGHYDDKNDAISVFETLMSNNDMPEPIVRDELKSMDANDLAYGLLETAEANGMDAEQFSGTLEFASLLHAGQKRRNRGNHETTPYIEHPLRVAYRLIRLGVRDNDIITAAMLHDTVEDCAQTFVKNFTNIEECSEEDAREHLRAHIEQTYNPRVAKIVMSVTNAYKTNTQARTQTQEEKYAEYKKHLEDEIVDNPEATLVKWGDFSDNAGGLHHNDVPGFEKRIKRMASKYIGCIDIFRQEFKKPGMPIPPESTQHVLDQLDRIEARLKGLIEKYSDIE